MALSKELGWIIGVSLSIFASWVGAASKLAIRASWKDVSGPGPHSPLVLARSKLKHGIGMFGMAIVNPACGVGAMAFANPSLLAPFSGLTLVWVVLFSKRTTGEEPTRTQVVAACTIILGEIVVTLCGDHEDDELLNIDLFNDIYRSSGMVWYFTCFAAFYALVILGTYSQDKFLQRVAWGLAGGSISGILLFVNDALALIGTDGFLHWQVFLFVFMAIFVGLFGLAMLSRCMKRYDATFSAAMFVVSYIFSATVMSIVRYDILSKIESAAQLGFYPVGMTILFIGCLMLMTEQIPGVCTCLKIGEGGMEDGKPLVEAGRRGADDAL